MARVSQAKVVEQALESMVVVVLVLEEVTCLVEVEEALHPLLAAHRRDPVRQIQRLQEELCEGRGTSHPLLTHCLRNTHRVQ